MSLVKILILSNVLDPTLSLQELIDAFCVVDEIESGDIEESWSTPVDARDAFVSRLALLL